MAVTLKHVWPSWRNVTGAFRARATRATASCDTVRPSCPARVVRMHILLACDKFKGTLTSAQVATALSPALTDSGHTVASVPIAAGGARPVAPAQAARVARRPAPGAGPPLSPPPPLALFTDGPDVPHSPAMHSVLLLRNRSTNAL